MARSQSRWGSLLGFVGRVFGRGSEKSRRRGKSVAARRRLLVESLEIRSVMATDFAAISGLVFKDTSTNGYNAGEEVSGALIRLYVDDGDGVFEPGTQDLAPAVPISATATTNAQGIYRFNQLTAATYWVQQPAQTVGAVSLTEAHRLVTVTSNDADGTVGRTIDTFATNGPSVTASTNASPSSAFQAAPEAIGGERELYAEILHTTLAQPNVDQVQFSVNAGQLNLNPSFTSTGLYVATWDGADQNTGSLNASGLGGVDLTNGGQATAVRLRVSVAEPNGIATMRVFTDATHFSEMQLVIPERTTIPGGVADLLFPMNNFQVAGQAGGANFASVGAVVLEIEAVNDSMDGVASFIGTVGPTVKTQNFDNQTATDLAIVKTVDDNTPNRNQVVNFTITVTNNGPTTATGVQVTDNLPAGLVISGTPVPSTGSFTNGVWTIGTLGTTAGQNSATLTLPVQVTALGTAQGGVITNTATISALDQFDTNPNNNTDSEAL
ncbi:MAG TPA: hypothetical protein PLV92_10270, partial [Pirellulaceae bacterium]|nr:hypothetical protein [Pirellulaceae bacterium]